MYHYRESGLPDVYLINGYRKVKTPYGEGVAIEDVEGLHAAIANTLVEHKPLLTGAEVRFIRRFLELTQQEFATLLGVEEQSVRRWEKLARVPKQADHGVRLIFRDMTHNVETSLRELMGHIEKAKELATVRYRFRPRAKHKWQPGRALAAA